METFNTYIMFDPICMLSLSSKILASNTSFLYRSEEGFKFQIKTRLKKNMKTVVDVRKWTKDTYIAINNEEVITESDLSDHEFEKTICVRSLNLDKEAQLDEGRNLYEVLKLNFKDVRKLNPEDQDTVIFKAYKREIRLWHSDIAGQFGDTTMAQEVIFAYQILRNREKRVAYHNRADYSKGWLSKARWRSIFFTECETKEQKKRYRRRLVMMAISVGVGIAGLALCVFTGGTSIPVAGVALGAIFGSGLLGGSVQTLLRLTKRDSIENGCDTLKCLKTFTFGFLAGAITGGVGVGITSAIAGIGEAAVHAASLTLGEYIGMGAASAATGGAFFSLATDAEKILVDGEILTWKQIAGHALAGAIIGSVTGIAVGAVSGAYAARLPTNVTPAEKQFVPAIRRVTASMFTTFSKLAVEKGSDAALGLIANFIEERCDDEQENRTGYAHLKDAAIKVIANFTLDAVSKFASITVEHVKNEIALKNQLHKEGSPDLDVSTSQQERRQRKRFELDLKHKRYYLTLADCIVKSSYNPNTQSQQSMVNKEFDNFEKVTSGRFRYISEGKIAVEKGSDGEILTRKHIAGHSFLAALSGAYAAFLPTNMTTSRFRYISEGLWKSRMIVVYRYKGKVVEKIATSGYALEIPIEAEKIKVCFQVMRFINTWCYVKKWDRFQKKWYEDHHIFIYETQPEQRFFTLNGPLYYERVINVTNEMHDDVMDM